MVKNINRYCFWVGCLHGVMGIIFFSLAIAQDKGSIKVDRLKTPVTAVLGAWIEDHGTLSLGSDSSPAVNLAGGCKLYTPAQARVEQYRVVQLMVDRGELDTRALIIVFHFLSCVFQVMNSFDEKSYMAELNGGRVHTSHFFEYSISASVMVIAICGQLGVTDLYLILNIALNCWSCMILGAIAEACFEHRDKLSFTLHMIGGVGFVKVALYQVAHFSGWVVLLAGSIVGALSNVALNDQCISSDGTRIPPAILGLVYTEIVLFLLFGMVQLLWFRARHNLDLVKDEDTKLKQATLALTTEASYITLSATAKIILGLGIFLSNLR